MMNDVKKAAVWCPLLTFRDWSPRQNTMRNVDANKSNSFIYGHYTIIGLFVPRV